MKEIYQLPDSLPKFFGSDLSNRVLVEFGDGDVLYVVGTVDVCVVEGEIEVWGFAIAADVAATRTMYSCGRNGLMSIASTGGGRKAIVSLRESGDDATRWKAFMKEYATDFDAFDIIGTRLTPPKPVRELEEQLGCWFDLSKTPMSHRRLVIEEQWEGFCDDLLGRPINQQIRVLLAGYKNVGKTTMMHYFINKCLRKWDKILVLDFDVGQSEFFIPACVSAFVVDAPLLGPNFTHLLQPFKSYFFESNDCMTNVPMYIKSVEKLVDDIKANDLQMPCFINTMGFVEGPGLEILYKLISKVEPTDVIQMKFNECQDLNLHSSIINDNTQSSLSYDLWYFTSVVKNKLAKAPYLQNVNKRTRRDLITISYFSKCLKGTNVYFNDVVPYVINANNINIHIKDIEDITLDESLDVINANVIALCVSSASSDLCECAGFGIVRGINKCTGDIYVVTPVTPNLLNRVNQLRLGNVYLPPTFYTKGTQMSKYVSVKQDNIFNEEITRHYKIMT